MAAPVCPMFAGAGWNSQLAVNDRPFHSQVDERIGHWRREPSDPGVSALRESLRARNGLAGLETVDMATVEPAEVERAARLFHRDGFVCLTGVLVGEVLERTARGVERVMRTLVEIDPEGLGTNGAHRYSFGGCSVTRHMLHDPAWRGLVDLPGVTAVLSAVFGSPNYLCRGGGGELTLPGAVEYQALHSDQHDERGPWRRGQQPSEPPPLEGPEPLRRGSESLNGRSGSFSDPADLGLGIRDLPCSMIAVNFTMTLLTFENAPIRVIPGSARWKGPIPRLEDEPEEMRRSTLCPVPAGAAILRDARCWHGGTPNLSDEARAFPNVEYYAPWYHEPMPVSLPFEDWASLSPHGQAITRYIRADAGARVAGVGLLAVGDRVSNGMSRAEFAAARL